MNLIYYKTVLLIFLLCAINYFTGNNLKNNLRLFNIGVFVLLFTDVLKDPFQYPDMGGYADLLTTGYISGENINWGYLLINKIFRCVSVNFIFFNMTIATFVVVVYTNEVKKKSVNPIFSLLLYSLLIYCQSFWILRQALAEVIVLCSFKYILSRDLKRYAIAIVLALSMHSTAIIAAPLYFLYSIKLSKRNVILMLCVSIFSLFAFKSVAVYLMSGDSYYSSYLEYDGGDTSIRVLSKLFFVLIYIYTLREKCSVGINYIILICAIFNVFIYIAGQSFFGLFRMRLYFDICEILGLPLIIYSCKSIRSLPKRLLIKSSVLVYLVFIIVSFVRFIEGGNFDEGYRFFFE